MNSDVLKLQVLPLVAASATVTNGNTNNVTDGNTLRIGSKTYRFKDTPAAINDVQIGASADASFDNLVAAINGTGTPGTEYFAGTVADLLVTSSAVDTHVITLISILGGSVSNEIALVRVGTYITVSAATLGGGSGGVAEKLTLDAAGTYNTDIFDMSPYTEAIAFLNTRSHVGSTGTLDVKFQLSPDGENWVDGDAFVQVTTADTVTIKRLTNIFGKYMRAVITLGGTTPEYMVDLKIVAKG